MVGLVQTDSINNLFRARRNVLGTDVAGKLKRYPVSCP